MYLCAFKHLNCNIMAITKLDQLVELVKSKPKKRLVAANANDAHTIEAVYAAVELGVIDATLVGNPEEIGKVCKEHNFDMSKFTIVPEYVDTKAAAKACDLINAGEGQILMKGLLPTDKYMRAILNKEKGLCPPKATLSHVTVIENPAYHKLLIVGDVAVIPAPELKEKQQEQKKQQEQQQPSNFTGPFADFRRLDVRVGTIISVEDHPEAEKLYVLKVDLGEEEPRQLVTNIKSIFPRDYMMGRRLLVISNLKKAKFRGVDSFGMLMAADDEKVGGNHLALLKPNIDVPNGTKINCGLENSSSRIELKHFELVTIKASSIVDGKFMGKDIKLPPNAPKYVVAVVDGDNVIPFGDGKDCVITVDEDSEILDGADVR